MYIYIYIIHTWQFPDMGGSSSHVIPSKKTQASSPPDLEIGLNTTYVATASMNSPRCTRPSPQSPGKAMGFGCQGNTRGAGQNANFGNGEDRTWYARTATSVASRLLHVAKKMPEAQPGT